MVVSEVTVTPALAVAVVCVVLLPLLNAPAETVPKSACVRPLPTIFSEPSVCCTTPNPFADKADCRLATILLVESVWLLKWTAITLLFVLGADCS